MSLENKNWLTDVIILGYMKTYENEKTLILDHNTTTKLVNNKLRGDEFIFKKVIFQ